MQPGNGLRDCLAVHLPKACATYVLCMPSRAVERSVPTNNVGRQEWAKRRVSQRLRGSTAWSSDVMCVRRLMDRYLTGSD